MVEETKVPDPCRSRSSPLSDPMSGPSSPRLRCQPTVNPLGIRSRTFLGSVFSGTQGPCPDPTQVVFRCPRPVSGVRYPISPSMHYYPSVRRNPSRESSLKTRRIGSKTHNNTHTPHRHRWVSTTNSVVVSIVFLGFIPRYRYLIRTFHGRP